MEHTLHVSGRALSASITTCCLLALVAGCGGGRSGYLGRGGATDEAEGLTYTTAGGTTPPMGAGDMAQAPALPRTTATQAHGYTPPVSGFAHDTEQYAPLDEVGFRSVEQAPLSTFSVDVDTASYSNVRRFLLAQRLPPPDAVRIEEMINYFDYAYGAPAQPHPIGIATELSDSPYSPGRKLLRVGLSARDPEHGARPARNLVFLVDVSGSMAAPNKLPLLQRALSMLVEGMDVRDRIAIVTYAGNSGVALPTTRGDAHRRILDTLRTLQSGGSTHGSAGIELAYRLAEAERIPGAVNRVILATDGDFNVGITDRGSLERLIEHERERGIFLTVLGFGMGNLKDATMETLADRGNGNYAYIETLAEARKVLVDEAAATLVTVAKDTKLQVELNPARVARYRLIGYDNRRLADEDFNDDQKDAGDMGDGHSVTALYELELVGAEVDEADPGRSGRPEVDALRYQQPRAPSAHADGGELLTIKVRYKTPEGQRSRLLTRSVSDAAVRFESASVDLRFAAAVAGFGMLLRGSQHAGDLTLGEVERIASGALGQDAHGYRRELVRLVRMARGARGEVD